MNENPTPPNNPTREQRKPHAGPHRVRKAPTQPVAPEPRTPASYAQTLRRRALEGFLRGHGTSKATAVKVCSLLGHEAIHALLPLHLRLKTTMGARRHG